MSGRVALTPLGEIGLPPLASTKWLPSTRRDTKIWWIFGLVSSSQTTQGTVAFAEFIVPAATRGSSALWLGSLLSEHFASLASDSAQAPNLFAPLVSSGSAELVPFPTASQRKPPSAASFFTALAAKTISFSLRGISDSSVSYQTTHGTLSSGPVKAM